MARLRFFPRFSDFLRDPTSQTAAVPCSRNSRCPPRNLSVFPSSRFQLFVLLGDVVPKRLEALRCTQLLCAVTNAVPQWLFVLRAPGRLCRAAPRCSHLQL